MRVGLLICRISECDDAAHPLGYFSFVKNKTLQPYHNKQLSIPRFVFENPHLLVNHSGFIEAQVELKPILGAPNLRREYTVDVMQVFHHSVIAGSFFHWNPSVFAMREIPL